MKYLSIIFFGICIILTPSMYAQTISNIIAVNNPFSSETDITFSLQKYATIKMEISDVLGQIYYSLEEGYREGENRIVLSGKGLPYGVLYARFSSTGGTKETITLKHTDTPSAKEDSDESIKKNYEEKGYKKENSLYIKALDVQEADMSAKGGVDFENFNFVIQKKWSDDCNPIWTWVTKDKASQKLIAEIELPPYMDGFLNIRSIFFDNIKYIILEGTPYHDGGNDIGDVVLRTDKNEFFKIYYVTDNNSVFIDGVTSKFNAKRYVCFPKGKPPQPIVDYLVNNYYDYKDSKTHFYKPEDLHFVDGELCHDNYCDGSTGSHYREKYTFDTTSFLKMGININEPYAQVRKRLLQNGWKKNIQVNSAGDDSKYPEIRLGGSGNICSGYLKKGNTELELGIDKCERVNYVGVHEKEKKKVPKKEIALLRRSKKDPVISNSNNFQDRYDPGAVSMFGNSQPQVSTQPQQKNSTFVLRRNGNWEKYETVTGHYIKYDHQRDRVSECNEQGFEVTVNPMPTQINPINRNGTQLR